jgi:hypothetical protein
MTSKKRAIIAVVAVAMMFLFLFILLPCGMSLQVRDSAGKVYFEKSVRPGDSVSLGFTHSVEKVQIVDTFIVQADCSLLLTNTTFDSSGAGIPSELSYNITVDENGNFTIKDINQTFESVNFITSATPKHYLIISGVNYPIFSLVPEAKPLFLLVERNTASGIVFNKIRGYI